MTELSVTRDPANKHAFVLETVGRVVTMPKKLGGTVAVEVADAAAWRWEIGGLKSHPVWEAVEEGNGTVAVFYKHERRFSHDGRELTLTYGRRGWLKGGPWVLSEAGTEIARFPHREWGFGKLKVAVVDDRTFRRDTRLMLFAAWVAQRISASAVL